MGSRLSLGAVGALTMFQHPPAVWRQQQSLTVPFCPISLTQGFLKTIQPLPAVPQGLRNASQELFRNFLLSLSLFCPQTQLCLQLPSECACAWCASTLLFYQVAQQPLGDRYCLYLIQTLSAKWKPALFGGWKDREPGERGLCFSMLLLNSCFTVCKQDSDSSH